jgi:hypothetical protein
MLTEQELDAPDATLAGMQLNDVSAGGGDSVIITLRDTPFKLAVTIRVTLLIIAPAVTVKIPVDDPPATATDPGVVR